MKKGITLVALVVTIVILLILATVTIGLILGDNSMFNRAEEGKDKTEFTQLGERLQSAGASVIVDAQTNPSFAKNTLSTVSTQLNSYLSAGDQTKFAGGNFTKGSENVYTFRLDSDNEKFELVYTLNLDANESTYTITDK